MSTIQYAFDSQSTIFEHENTKLITMKKSSQAHIFFSQDKSRFEPPCHLTLHSYTTVVEIFTVLTVVFSFLKTIFVKIPCIYSTTCNCIYTCTVFKLFSLFLSSRSSQAANIALFDQLRLKPKWAKNSALQST